MKTVTLLTLHGKGPLIAPELSPLGYEVYEYTDFDTDSLGMFSGEIKRTVPAQEAALIKARKACELGDTDFGLGSEGSFGGGPYPGLINWDTELICWFDRRTDQAIFAIAQGPCPINFIEASDEETLHRHLEAHPGQRWMFRESGTGHIHKGLCPSHAMALFRTTVSQHAFRLEPDLRAHHSPARQDMIRKAAKNLAERLGAFCPQCGAPDFVTKAIQEGLLCELCGSPTRLASHYIHRCDCCGHQQIIPSPEHCADPMHCDYCNP